MDIRLAGPDDVQAISALIYGLTEKYVVTDFPARAGAALLVSMLPEGIRKHMLNGCRYHVAELDANIIGVIGVKDNKHLYHLFVAEEHQRRGIARRLWRSAEAACRAAGHAAEFSVNSSLRAQAMYEKLGFVAQSTSRTRDGVVTIPMVLTPPRE
jgi:ribosomal protein S18 acetylase RimI-like enzyme